MIYLVIIEFLIIIFLGYHYLKLYSEFAGRINEIRKQQHKSDEKTNYDYICAYLDPDYPRNWKRSGKYKTYKWVILPFKQGKYNYTKKEVEELRVYPAVEPEIPNITIKL